MNSAELDELAAALFRKLARPVAVALMFLLGLLFLDVTLIQSVFIATTVTALSALGIGTRRFEQLGVLVFVVGAVLWLDFPAVAELYEAGVIAIKNLSALAC